MKNQQHRRSWTRQRSDEVSRSWTRQRSDNVCRRWTRQRSDEVSIERNSSERWGVQLRRTERRRGAVLVGVLACMVICTSLVALTLQSAIRGRQEARLAHHRSQALWLCEAGILRARERLKNDSEFRGETWRPDLNLATYSLAEVEIQVKPLEADQERVQVQVQSRLDAVTHSFGPLQHTEEFQYTISTQ